MKVYGVNKVIVIDWEMCKAKFLIKTKKKKNECYNKSIFFLISAPELCWIGCGQSSVLFIRRADRCQSSVHASV